MFLSGAYSKPKPSNGEPPFLLLSPRKQSVRTFHLGGKDYEAFSFHGSDDSSFYLDRLKEAIAIGQFLQSFLFPGLPDH